MWVILGTFVYFGNVVHVWVILAVLLGVFICLFLALREANWRIHSGRFHHLWFDMGNALGCVVCLKGFSRCVGRQSTAKQRCQKTDASSASEVLTLEMTEA